MDLFDRRKLFRILVSINLLLVAMYLATNVLYQFPSWKVKHMFDLDQEYNFPTWFSSTQLFLVFLLSLVCARQTQDGVLRRGYHLLGAVFLFFSVDETAMIHEMAERCLRAMPDGIPLLKFKGVWIFAYLFLFLMLVLYYRKEIISFLKIPEGRTAFVAGAAAFVSAGTVFEMIGNQIPPSSWLKPVVIMFEEGFEMLGQSMMIFGLMSRLKLR
jgi:hypothetical protein